MREKKGCAVAKTPAPTKIEREHRRERRRKSSATRLLAERSHIRTPPRTYAERILAAKLKRLGTSYAELSARLADVGIRTNPVQLAKLAKRDGLTFRHFVRLAEMDSAAEAQDPTSRSKQRRSSKDKAPADGAGRVREQIEALVADGTLSDLEAQAAVEAIRQQRPDEEDPTDLLGPYYDTAGLRRRLAVTRQALAGRVQRNTMLGVETDDGKILYPTWQFGHDFRVLDALPPILQELHRAAKDGFSKAVWLATPQDALDHQTAIQWITDSKSPEVVHHLAKADVDRMLA